MRQLHVNLTDNLYGRLEQYCEQTGLTKASYVKLLLLASLKDEPIARMEVRPQVPSPAELPKQAQEQPRKWYEGMPFRKGGAK